MVVAFWLIPAANMRVIFSLSDDVVSSRSEQDRDVVTREGSCNLVCLHQCVSEINKGIALWSSPLWVEESTLDEDITVRDVELTCGSVWRSLGWATSMVHSLINTREVVSWVAAQTMSFVSQNAASAWRVASLALIGSSVEVVVLIGTECWALLRG